MPRTLCKARKGPPHPAMPGSDLCAQHAGFPPIGPRTPLDSLRILLAEAEERDDAELVAALRAAIDAVAGKAT